MSRKDPRKSILICPDRDVWKALKAGSNRSMGDAVRRAVANTNWDRLERGAEGRGAKIAVQLPPKDYEALKAVATRRGLRESDLLLAAVRDALL